MNLVRIASTLALTFSVGLTALPLASWAAPAKPAASAPAAIQAAPAVPTSTPAPVAAVTPAPVPEPVAEPAPEPVAAPCKPAPAPAAPAAPVNLGGAVTVIGVGEVLAGPDIVTLVVEAVNNDDSPADASADTRRAMNQILAAARKTVANPNDLRTTRISINPEYEWVEGKRKFRGYTASQSLEITLRELPRLDSLLEYLNKAPFTTLGNLEFRHSKADSLHREARVLAIRNAALNAKSLCAAAGRSCDELVGVRAGGAQGGGPVPYPAMEMKAMRADGGTAMPVQAGLLSFPATVEADYRLK